MQCAGVHLKRIYLELVTPHRFRKLGSKHIGAMPDAEVDILAVDEEIAAIAEVLGDLAALPAGQRYAEVLFDVDRAESSEPLRSTRLCQVLLEKCVVSVGCQVHDTPQVLRV